MGRPLRIEFPGAVYHVTARGNRRQDVFLDAVDRERFLERLSFIGERLVLVTHSYCLMDNHFHLLLETPRANLSRAMQQLLSGYARLVHKRLGTTGHLFQARYHAVLIEKGTHVLEVARYLALNPVRAGLCERPADWPWSAHRALIGHASPSRCLTVDWLLRQFSDDRPTAQRRYQRFVDSASKGVSPVDQQATIIGTTPFAKHQLRSDPPAEVPDVRRRLPRRTVAELRSRYGDTAILKAYREYGYSLREIAVEFGLHYSTISRRLAALERATRATSDTRPCKT